MIGASAAAITGRTHKATRPPLEAGGNRVSFHPGLAVVSTKGICSSSPKYQLLNCQIGTLSRSR